MANFNSIITATLALAIAFTFSCSSNDSGSSNGGDPVGSTKDSCIRTELEIKANTLDEVAGACNATRGEVLAQLPSTIGNCNKNDLDFDKPLREIMEACNVAEIPVVSSSSNGVSSSGVVGSSSSVGDSSSGGSSSSTGGSSSSIVIERGTVEYEGYTYKTVKIGTQWWFAENLRYNTEGSVCYEGLDENCDKYGRLYDWATAMELPATYNNLAYVVDVEQGICPDGWRIPNNADWDKLLRYVDGSTGTTSPYTSQTAGGKLKAADGWDNDGNGTDEFGFSALPGGFIDADGAFLINRHGYWWTAKQYDNSEAHHLYMRYNNTTCGNSRNPKSELSLKKSILS